MARCVSILVLLGLLGCPGSALGPGDRSDDAGAFSDPGPSDDAGSAVDAGLGSDPLFTWHRDVAPLFQQRCQSCHQPGAIGPFELGTLAQVRDLAPMVESAITSRRMPPWKAGPNCNEYQGDISLSDDQIGMVQWWIADGMPEGDPEDAVVPEPQRLQALARHDLILEPDEPFLAQRRPDDYRCFVLDWPETQRRYITGFEALPGDPRLVHHVIAFRISAENRQEILRRDERDPGLGYTCFGSPGVIEEDGTWWLGSWAPGFILAGSVGAELPEGIGLPMEPGDTVVIQVHYNTTVLEPQPDLTRVAFMLEDEVDRPARWLPFADPDWIWGAEMPIPEGDPDVRHSFQIDPTLYPPVSGGRPFLIHDVGLHMHLLGRQIRLDVLKGSGGQECLMDVPDWDFNWQPAARLAQPYRFEPGDQLKLQCQWDNTAANQPVLDGERLTPRPQNWGDGTTDEMCLGLMLVSVD